MPHIWYTCTKILKITFISSTNDKHTVLLVHLLKKIKQLKISTAPFKKLSFLIPCFLNFNYLTLHKWSEYFVQHLEIKLLKLSTFGLSFFVSHNIFWSFASRYNLIINNIHFEMISRGLRARLKISVTTILSMSTSSSSNFIDWS